MGATTLKDPKGLFSRMGAIVENWNERISLVEEVNESPLSFEKKIVLAQCLENTQLAIDMLEATDSGDTSGFKQFGLDLVTAIVPNLVANDFVSVQPIDNEVGVINYIRYLYGSSKGSAVQGNEFASGLLYTGSDFYYSSQEVVGEGLAIDAGKTKVTGTIAWKPIIKGTIKIPLTVTMADASKKLVYFVDTPKDGTLIATDPVTGLPVANTLSVAGGALGATVNYDNGAVAIETVGVVTTSTVVMNYAYDQKSIGTGAIGSNQLAVPEVDIKIETMPVICQSRKLKALYAFDAAFKLQKEYGSDINALLNSQIAAEIAHEIDGEIMEDLRSGAGLVNDSWNRAVPQYIGIGDHYESFYATLIVGSNKIFGATKRANGTFLIVGLNVSSVLEVMPSFVASGARNVIGPHISGTIGNMIVIKNPYFPPDEYVMGYKGLSLFDAGYFYCPYMPVITTQLVMLDDFVGRKGWATSYAKKMVQPLLYCRGEITNIPAAPA